jgi:quinol-cytochrome oxidoreductase complex cytochrome b subunit
VPANFVGEWATAWMGFIFIEAKLAGVLAMFGSIAVLFILPWLDRSPVRSSRFRPMYKWFFWIFFIDCIVLGYVGAKPAEGVYIAIGRVATIWYFAHFLVIMPLLAKFEKTRDLPKSISEPVLGGGRGSFSAATAKPMEKA